MYLWNVGSVSLYYLCSCLRRCIWFYEDIIKKAKEISQKKTCLSCWWPSLWKTKGSRNSHSEIKCKITHWIFPSPIFVLEYSHNFLSLRQLVVVSQPLRLSSAPSILAFSLSDLQFLIHRRLLFQLFTRSFSFPDNGVLCYILVFIRMPGSHNSDEWILPFTILSVINFQCESLGES